MAAPPAEAEVDLALVERARAGDKGAVDDLLRRHYDRIYALCRRLTGNDADAADASQEAMIAIVRGLARFDGRSAFSTWSYRVATNAALDELRRRKRRPDPGLPGDDGEFSYDRLASTGRDPADTVSTRIDIDAALASLPPDYRAAVVLRDLAGMSYEEIAETLGIPPGTVRSRIARGRAALVPHLSDSGNPGSPSRRPSR